MFTFGYMTRHFIRILLLTMLLLSNVLEAQQYNFRNFNVENGLAQSQVYAIVQDNQGMLWMGTRGGGITVFNGYEFQTLDKSKGLTNVYINRMVKDAAGTVWVAGNAGVGYFSEQHYHPVAEGLVVNDLEVQKDGSLVAATAKGVFRISDGAMKRIGDGNLDLHGSISSVTRDEKGNYWLGTDKGLLRLAADGKLTNFGKDVPVMRNSITRVRQDKTGKIWIGTYGDGLYCYDGKNFFRIDLHHELYKQTILDIYFDEASNLWLATLNGGVIQYNRETKTFSSFTEREGLSNNHVRCIIKDNSGSFWFGTSGGGVSQYTGKQFTHYDERSGLGGNFIYSVYRDRSGRLWVGNSKAGVSVIYKDSIAHYHAGNGFDNVKVKAIAEDGRGTVFLGTDGQGVYVVRNGSFEPIQDLARAYVKDMKSDRQGNVWIATAGSGLIKVETRQNNFILSRWTTAEGLASNRITSIHIDKLGRVWYGAESHGVGCIDMNQVSKLRITTAEGLTSPLIRCLTEDAFGRLWIGTAGGGVSYYPLYRFKKSVYTINTENGLLSNNIYSLTVDQAGRLIVGSEKGLDQLYFNQDEQLVQVRHYGKYDGFLGVETCQNAVFNDDDAVIWIGTINGLSRFNTRETGQEELPPLISLKTVRLFYEPILTDDSLSIIQYGKQRSELILDYNQNHLTFEFFGVNLRNPEGVRYQWKLDGFDSGWSPLSADRSILYSNLNPGRYRFQVRAVNQDGTAISQPASFEFTVLAPFWKQAWFVLLVSGTILIVLLLSYTLLVRRIRNKARQKQQQVELEKSMLELEQKALRLQMNPHFIFNALNSIQSLIGTGQEKEARYYLAKFSRLMRQILDNSRKTVISLQEEIQTLENYLLIEQFCTNGRFHYEISSDDDLEVDFIQLPPMLIQPFVENAIKHGMKGRDEQNPGTIRISFSETGQALRCTITDDGIGRVKAQQLVDESKETYHESMSLKVTLERLERMENNEVKGSLEIRDLYRDDQAIGTEVIITIPLE